MTGSIVTTQASETFRLSDSKTSAPPPVHKMQISWMRVIYFSLTHMIAMYGLYLAVCGYVQIKTIVFGSIVMFYGILSVTAGVHRLWSHRSYTATLPLRLFLMIGQTISVQFSIYNWVRDHRGHHKWTDTNADPYDTSRGFFFAHIGWLLIYKHPDIKVKGNTIDLKDLEADGLVMFQEKHYWWFAIMVGYLLPAFIPYYFWNEVYWHSLVVVGLLGWTIILHLTLLVNSGAHKWGMKPYNKNISAGESLTVSMLSLGEGWHNYHHMYPSDYKAAELGTYSVNFTTAFLDFCAWLGLAYNMKTTNTNLIKNQSLKTGDGTYSTYYEQPSVGLQRSDN